MLGRAASLVMLASLSLQPSRAVMAQAPDEAARSGTLIIPQTEGARQGRIAGRAIACGVARERIEAVLRIARDKMRARVGARFTEERYLPALGQAIDFETGLGKPSDEACAKALESFAQLEAAP